MIIIFYESNKFKIFLLKSNSSQGQPYRNIVVICNVTMTVLEIVLLMCSSVKTIRGYFCSSDFNLDQASHERFYKARGD